MLTFPLLCYRNPLASAPFKSVRVDALVAVKIIKHATQSFPGTVTGQLLGMDIDGVLQVTNSFPFVANAADTSDDSPTSAVVAPRAKTTQPYQNEMIKYLREVNVDANIAGWYQSANMGNFINANFVENQYHYQSQINERTVALVYDSARSSQGGMALKAYRLTPQFMAAFKEGKFTTERYARFSILQT